MVRRVEPTYGLQGLLDLGVKGAALEGNDLGGRVGVVGDGAAALGAEDAVDVLAGGALASPGLGGALDGELVLGDDDDEGWFGEMGQWDSTTYGKGREEGCGAAYSRSSRTGAGSRRSDRSL